MNTHHKLLAVAAATALVLPSQVFATNGYQLIGVGAYQKGLAGAVTANPGSAMTAVSNPAGAARVGARADFSMEAFMPDRSVDFAAMMGDKADSSVSMYGVPALGWTAPTSDGSNLYFGGGMYGTSGMGVDYAVTDMGPGDWSGYSNISFWQMAPVLAWNLNTATSFGVALNIDYQSVALQQSSPMGTMDLSRAASGFGLGMGLGLMHDLNSSWTIGFAYKSKQNFDPLEYNLAAGDISFPATGDFPAGTYRLDMDFPQQASVGVAFHPGDKLTISADVKWIDWSDTLEKMVIDGPASWDVELASDWDDQVVYALGLEYALNERFSLRAGYNYASSPIEDEDVANNLILPAIVETHYTLGAGYQINNHWDVDVHYMYVPENTLTAPAADGAMEISLSETSFGANIGYRF